MEDLFIIATAGVGCVYDFHTTVATTRENAEETVRLMAKNPNYDFLFGDGITSIKIKNNRISIEYTDFGWLEMKERREWSLVPLEFFIAECNDE